MIDPPSLPDKMATTNNAPGSGSRCHRLILEPIQQIEKNAQGYRSTGSRPQFSVMSSLGRLPAGWAILSYRGQAKSIPLAPKLVIDEGRDWNEKNPVQLCRHHDGDTEELVKLPDSCQAMRLDPMEWDGLFALDDLRAREIGKIDVLLYLTRKYFRSRKAKRGIVFAAKETLRMFLELPRRGAGFFKDELLRDYRKNLVEADEPFTTSLWFRYYRIKPSQLLEMEQRAWPPGAPKFSLIMTPAQVPADWVRQAVESLQKQVYRNWELVCVHDASASPHIAELFQELAAADSRIMYSGQHREAKEAARTNIALKLATGDYVCFLEPHGFLEPHALFRFAEIAVAEHADLIYADEVETDSGDLNDIKKLIARPRFSHDYYLDREYFSHSSVVRRSLVESSNGIDETLADSHLFDLYLRVLEKAAKVSHVPDVLYRARQLAQADTAEDACGAAQAHLARLGFDAQVTPGPLPDTRQVRFFPPTTERVAIIIPTKNRVDLLRVCVDSILATIDRGDADIVVVDHASDDPLTQAYLADLAKEHTVLPHAGPFNFSRINNCAVEKIRGKYDYYLFMNNDIEAIEAGWFESMLDLAKRKDVGIVGATLLYPNSTVQHAGVIFASHGAAEHAYKGASFLVDGRRNPGHNHTLVASRDYSAITAACMLMRADVFHEVGGYDEELVVGFNDTDLCLRVAARGYRILNNAHAVLFHHESCTRGKSATDPHPTDTALFIKKYANMIQSEDPYFSPLLSNAEPEPGVRPNYYCPTVLKTRTVSNFLPVSGR